MRNTFLSAMTSLLMITCGVPAARADVNVGDRPPLDLKSMTGELITSADLDGRIVILEFWATWCGPCRAQLPHLKELNREYGNKGVVLISVSTDNAEQTARKFTLENQMTWTQVHDKTQDRPIQGTFGIKGIPHAFILSPDGEVLWRGHPARIEDPLHQALQQHPPRPKRSPGEAVSDIGVALSAIRTAREALAGQEPDWTALLSAIEPLTEKQLASPQVQAQARVLLKQAERKAATSPMDDAFIANPIAAKTWEMMTATLKSSSKSGASAQPAVNPKLAQAKLQKAQQAREKGEHLDAYEAYEWLTERTPESEPGQAAIDALAEYQADETLMAAIQAQRLEREALALLKMAENYLSTNNKDLARQTFQRVIDKYPDTKCSATAKQKLRSLG